MLPNYDKLWKEYVVVFTLVILYIASHFGFFNYVTSYVFITNASFLSGGLKLFHFLECLSHFLWNTKNVILHDIQFSTIIIITEISRSLLALPEKQDDVAKRVVIMRDIAKNEEWYFHLKYLVRKYSRFHILLIFKHYVKNNYWDSSIV